MVPAGPASSNRGSADDAPTIQADPFRVHRSGARDRDADVRGGRQSTDVWSEESANHVRAPWPGQAWPNLARQAIPILASGLELRSADRVCDRARSRAAVSQAVGAARPRADPRAAQVGAADAWAGRITSAGFALRDDLAAALTRATAVTGLSFAT